ncbi:hypothetical protein L211DRAFT_883373, partial [Terfezia boudieri ATCC MYA-4762]
KSEQDAKETIEPGIRACTYCKKHGHRFKGHGKDFCSAPPYRRPICPYSKSQLIWMERYQVQGRSSCKRHTPILVADIRNKLPWIRESAPSGHTSNPQAHIGLMIPPTASQNHISIVSNPQARSYWPYELLRAVRFIYTLAYSVRAC